MKKYHRLSIKKTRKHAPLFHLVALLLSFLLSLLLQFHATPAYAQDYLFSVPELTMDVYVNKDASARIVYDITFENNPGAHAIDIVDIGTPTKHYDFSNMQASIGGNKLTDIRTSEYIDVGVEIHLGKHAIRGGERGTLHFEFTMPDMVHQDTTNDELASLRITPTWFDSSLVTGTSNIVVAIHTLPGITLDELLYQNEKIPFTDKQMVNDVATGYWQWSSGEATQAYNVGISFPKAGMDYVVDQTAFDLLFLWLADNPMVILILSVIVALTVGIAFYKYTGKTGCLLTGLVLIGIMIICTNPSLIVFVIFLGISAYSAIRNLELKNTYLPAIAQVEGGGIKRGLTAVEAAVLLEQPPGKVLTLLVFGMLKKGVLIQTDVKPLTVELAPAFKNTNKNERLKAGQQMGIVLHTYEFAFLDEIESNAGKPIHQINFKAPMKALVKHVVKRVKGFDLSDTQDYYKRIIKRAYEQAKDVEIQEQREEKLDRNLEWILMNRHYGPVFETGHYHYTPSWARTTMHTGGGIGGGGSQGGGSGGGSSSGGGQVSFADVAGSFAGWTENTMGDVAKTLTPDSLGTRPVSTSSGGGFSGGGGGCACACAGCACACACAGGGR